MDGGSQPSLSEWELTDDQREKTRIIHAIMNYVEDIRNKSYLT